MHVKVSKLYPLAGHSESEIRSFYKHMYNAYKLSCYEIITSSMGKTINSSKEPQFAGLLAAYARRVVGDLSYNCPLCLELENKSRNNIHACPSFNKTYEGTGEECLAAIWCHKYAHRPSGDYDYVEAAYELVTKHCKSRGCTDLSWLPRINEESGIDDG